MTAAAHELETSLMLATYGVWEGEARCAYCDKPAYYTVATGADPEPEPHCRDHALAMIDAHRMIVATLAGRRDSQRGFAARRLAMYSSLEELRRDGLRWTRSDVEWIRDRIARGDLNGALLAASSSASLLNVCATIARHHRAPA